jgi:hypothetical protein
MDTIALETAGVCRADLDQRRRYKKALSGGMQPADEFHTRQITSKVDGAELV